MFMIDLHSHTTASDGRLSPTALVARAHAAGVTHLAVTDHDTVAGLPEALAAATDLGGIEVIAGIEISTSIGDLDIHVLGHFIRHEDAAVRAFTAAQEHERRARMERMVEKLRAMNLRIDMRDVEAVAGSDNLCRPHLARALVAKGICRDMQDAFAKYIGDDRPAFSAHRRPSALEAIQLIHDAGGVASIAHPASDAVERPQLIALRDAGLDGVEVCNGEQPVNTQEKYRQLARELGLIPTAGSDFHEDGGALGKVSLEPEAFAALRRAAASDVPRADR
jgi:predicted metal-dependent phosphoesterase TrpH